MDYEITKKQIISSLFWKLMERAGVQGIQFLVMIILARLLLPEDFGIIVIVTIFIMIANIFVQSGFNTALIQKKNVDEVDFSSVFYLNLFVTTLLYVVLFFIAPFIASFYEEPQLIIILRILSLSLFLGAINSIQNAIISRRMQFKKLFFSGLGASIVAGIISIAAAYTGFGVWALVAHQLTSQLLVTVILWLTLDWRPKFLFSTERLRSLFSFGWKLLFSSLLDSFYSNVRSLIIGKMFSPALLGFYSRGDQFPSFLVNNINGSIQSVMLPALASHQDNRKRVKEMVRRSIVTSSFVIFPMMVGLAVIAEPLVTVLLTEKWLPSVPFLQIFCIAYALWPIHTANLQAINALGRSDIYLKLEIIKKLVGIEILIVTIPYGVYAMAIGVGVSSVLSSFINAYPNSMLLNYSILEQFYDITPSFFLSLLMGAMIYPIHWLGFSAILTLIVQIVAGIIIYVVFAKLFKMECFTYLVMTMNGMKKSEKKPNIIIKEAME